MEISHPIVAAGCIIGGAFLLLAIFKKIDTAYFGSLVLKGTTTRYVIGSLGALLTFCSVGLTFSPSSFDFLIMGEIEKDCNRPGPALQVHVVNSPKECRKACAQLPTCNFWTYQPGYRSNEGYNCFLRQESSAKENLQDVWSGIRRPIAWRNCWE